jgi:GTP-binding protein
MKCGGGEETLDFRLGFIDFARVRTDLRCHGMASSVFFESVREAWTAPPVVRTRMLTLHHEYGCEDHQPPLVTVRGS